MIVPLAPCVYQNRTSFTTLTPLQPTLPWLDQIDACQWSKSVYGWYEGMKLHVPGVPPAVALWFLDQVPGRLVRLNIYGETVWEGLVWEVSAVLPGATITKSLSDMANRVYIEYADELTNANTVSDASEDTDLQAMYGIKEVYLPAGTRTETNAGEYAARYLDSHKYPPAVREITERPIGLGELTLECKGYYQTLAFQYYTSTTTGTQDSATTIADINTSKGAFIASTSLAATGRTSQRHFAQRQTAWEQILSMVGLGTANDLKYFLGVKTGRVLTGWEEPITLRYMKYPQKPGMWYDAVGGFPLQYWQVEPGQWVSVALPPGDVDPVSYLNPRAMLIGSCVYDGVARTVKPSYEIRVPAVQSSQATAGAQYNPLTRPWTYWEAWHGYRDVWVGNKWVHQEMGWYKRDMGRPDFMKDKLPGK